MSMYILDEGEVPAELFGLSQHLLYYLLHLLPLLVPRPLLLRLYYLLQTYLA
jgi:hypothetical protein